MPLAAEQLRQAHVPRHPSQMLLQVRLQPDPCCTDLADCMVNIHAWVACNHGGCGYAGREAAQQVPSGEVAAASSIVGAALHQDLEAPSVGTASGPQRDEDPPDDQQRVRLAERQVKDRESWLLCYEAVFHVL